MVEAGETADTTIESWPMTPTARWAWVLPFVAERHDRMPVMLHREKEQRWLEADEEAELHDLLDPLPEGAEECWSAPRIYL